MRTNYIVYKDTLAREGVSYTTYLTSMEIVCFGITYKKQRIIPKSSLSDATDLCKKFISNGYDSFLTETPSYYHLWVADSTKSPQYNNGWWQQYVNNSTASSSLLVA